MYLLIFVNDNTVGIWNPTIFKSGNIWNLDFLKVGFQMVGFSYGYIFSPNDLKAGPFEILTFLPSFQIVFDKMAPICPDFKWLGFQISDPIKNPDHLQSNLFLTIQNPD